MKYRDRFLHEVARFERCQPGVSRTDLGLAQFYRYESTGARPADADPYFSRLRDGKRWWEWTLNQCRDLYFTRDWWGWAQIEEDFADDLAGLRQVEARGMSSVRWLARGEGRGAWGVNAHNEDTAGV